MTSLIAETKKAYQLTNALWEKDFAVFEKVYKDSVEELKNTDQSFYFQGGWLKHAVVYEIRKTSTNPDRYSFRAFNSGEGLEFHVGALISGRILKYPYIEKINVSLDRLTSKSFIKIMHDLRRVTESGNNSSSSDLYRTVAHILDGNLSTQEPMLEDLLDPQVLGTCAYYSIP